MWRCDRHRLLRHQQRWRWATMVERRKPRQWSFPSFRSSPIVLLFYILPDMLRKSVLKPTLVSLLSILALYAVFTASLSFFNGRLLVSSSSVSGEHRTPPSTVYSPVKLYMYHLPRKFTYGVIENYAIARGDLSTRAEKDLRYPGNQHSAEWWLFTDLLREDRPETSPVARVFDPEEADLFYVPFFSSLSLVVNPIRPSTTPENGALYSDEEMQEDLIRWLEEEQRYWKRNHGRDHVFICQDPNALYKVIDAVKNSVLLVSDFGRLRADQASLVKDVILPYSHRINAYKGEVGVELRKSLLFFMGNRYRKEGGKIRNLLFQVLENEDDVIIKHGTQSRESRRAATQGMHSSKFCLHPAGDTPSACRLFDAIVSLCIPVIVSDQIELPFEDVIDYRKIAIFVDSTSAIRPGYLIKMLRQIKPEKVLEFQHELKEVRHYYEYEDPNGTVREIWHQVALKNQLIRLMINRDKRIVKRDWNDPDCSCICSHQNRTATMRL